MPRGLHARHPGLQPQVEAEAIDRSHLRLLCLNACKPIGEQNERILYGRHSCAA